VRSCRRPVPGFRGHQPASATFARMDELQAVVAAAADRADAHSTAPALLLQAVAALGQLSATTNAATEGGRRPFRIPAAWSEQLSELAYVTYLLADQTGVDIDASVRAIAEQVQVAAAAETARVQAQRTEKDWF
jgi:hypothetical protein